MKNSDLAWIICILIAGFLSTPTKAQESKITLLEKECKDLYGIDKLEALNQLSEYFHKANTRKALRYGKQAVALSENIFIESNSMIDLNKRHYQAQAYLILGKIQFDRENYFDAQTYLKSAKELSTEIDHKIYKDEADTYLRKIDELITSGKISESFISKTLGNLKVGQAINEGKKELVIQSEVKIAKSRENKGDLQGAIKHYEKVISLLKNKGDAAGIKEYQIKVAILLDSLNEHIQAQKFLSEAITNFDDSKAEDSSNFEVGNSTEGMISSQISENISLKSLQYDQDKLKELKKLATDFASEKNFKKSLAYEKMYNELARKIEIDSLRIVVKNKQTASEILLLKQQRKIADLNVNEIEKENERQVKYRNILVFIAIFVFVSAFIIFYFYSAKKKEHHKLTITHNALQKTKSKLVDAEEKIVALLKQQLSGDIAQKLLGHETNEAAERSFVCIMFLDIREFTPIAEKLSPEELIAFQNKVFGFMIDEVERFNGNINQLLGDGFMATFGAPVSHGNDCQNAFSTAQQILKELKDRCNSGVIPKIKIGIGLHAGHVVTGNVGNETRKQYSVTGNPVIIASRVEQLNKEYNSQLIITEEVYEQLEEQDVPKESFLDVNVKGRVDPIRILTFS